MADRMLATPRAAGRSANGSAAEAELASALRISVMRLARRLRAERVAPLTLTQISALASLDREGPLTPSELAAEERVQPPSMTRILAGLEERGLVTRAAHPSDGRQVIVSTTEESRALLREDRRRREAWLVDHLIDLTAAERDLLSKAADVLDRLARS